MGVHGYHPSHISQKFNKRHYFYNYLLNLDAYSKIPKLYGMENITNKKVMYKLYMFQSRFVKLDEFGWFYMERIQTYAAVQFTSKEFQENLSVRGVRLLLVAPEHQ